MAPKKEELKWIGVDWDDTIFLNNGYPDFIPTKPIQDAVESLRKLVKKGFKIIIYTARPWSDYQLIEDLCIKHKIPARRIICGKPLFKFFIDDKAIRFTGNWKETLKEVDKSI